VNISRHPSKGVLEYIKVCLVVYKMRLATCSDSMRLMRIEKIFFDLSLAAGQRFAVLTRK
jgi:hypothetical protein